MSKRPKSTMEAVRTVDEEFVPAPVDMRHLPKLEEHSVPNDDQDLAISLSVVIGRNVATRSREKSPAIEDLRRLVVEIEQNMPQKKQFTLGERLQPIVHERFCPEKGYIERFKQKTGDRYPEVRVPGKRIARDFPANLYCRTPDAKRARDVPRKTAML